MKVDLIRKYKWYIVGLIMSFIMISVSLSFCQWDDNSINSLKASGGSGDYMHKYYTIAENRDNSLGSDATVGDIVTFGKYYQDDKEIIKTPLRWIVVDIRPNIKNSGKQDLYLLTESVVAFGNFDYRHYYNGSAWVWEGETKYNQRYNDSTIRAWLNSEARNDGGVGFTANDPKKVFNGFYREAFDTAEQNAIIPRNLDAMSGCSKDNASSVTTYPALNNQKVWLPSWTEIYGAISSSWGSVRDSGDDKQFSYFSSVSGYGTDPKKVGKTTPFASTASLSNYTTKAAIHQGNSQSVGAGSVSPVWWWLRSPDPDEGHRGNAVLMVGADGSADGCYMLTCYSRMAVRPAVCVAR